MAIAGEKGDDDGEVVDVQFVDVSAVDSVSVVVV